MKKLFLSEASKLQLLATTPLTHHLQLLGRVWLCHFYYSLQVVVGCYLMASSLPLTRVPKSISLKLCL